MSKIHLEILDKKRQKVFYKLDSFKRLGYLAGGTALSLQIKHRKSYDFDIFVNKPISNFFKLKVRKVFGEVNYYINTSDQISFRTKDGINITFLWYYFKPIEPLVKTSSIKFASVKDIGVDKAYTIGRRALWRDYVDLYFLLRGDYIGLDEIIKLAKKKFAGEFSPSLFLEQLCYFEDLEIVPIDYISYKPESSEIKQFLQSKVKEYLKRKL